MSVKTLKFPVFVFNRYYFGVNVNETPQYSVGPTSYFYATLLYMKHHIWCFIAWPTLGLFWTMISIVTLSLLVQCNPNDNPNIEVLSSNTFFAQLLYFNGIKVYRFIVFHATFNNISAISWRSILLVEYRRKPSTCSK